MGIELISRILRGDEALVRGCHVKLLTCQQLLFMPFIREDRALGIGIENWFLIRIDKKWLNPLTLLAFILDDPLINSLYYARVDGPYVN